MKNCNQWFFFCPFVSGIPVESKVNIFINSFGSIQETTMVSITFGTGLLSNSGQIYHLRNHFLHRTTEWISSFARDGMILDYDFLLILRVTHWLWTQRCSSVFGSQTFSLPMRKMPTFMMWPRTTFFCLSSEMEMSWSVWGTHFLCNLVFSVKQIYSI